MALRSYCLKMSESAWDEVDRNRMSLVGTLYPEGITRADYIREAINQYNRWHQTIVQPKVESLTKDIDEPLGFYVDDGLDVRW